MSQTMFERFDELAAAIDDEGEAEPLDEIELAAVAAAEEGIGAKTLRRGLAAVQARLLTSSGTGTAAEGRGWPVWKVTVTTSVPGRFRETT